MKERKKLFHEYKVRVDGRLFEVSHTEQRKNWIVPVLGNLYPNAKIEVEPYNHFVKGDYQIRQLERIINEQLEEYAKA